MASSDSDDTLGMLPDVVLISVFKYLSLEDLINVSKVNDRLSALSRERCIVKKCDFEGFYFAREEDVRYHVGACRHLVERLSFNFCHWLPARTLQWAIGACNNLRELHLIECRLRTETLVTLLAEQRHLQALSFSISSFTDIKRDMFDCAQVALKALRRLHLYYTSTEMVLMRYLGESTTIFDYCHNLEELVIDSAGMAVPELYRPIISNPAVHSKLKVLTLTPNIHAGAQMFFYGTLQQLPNAGLPWRTLLMPNVNFAEFARKPEFCKCLQDVEKLENLDLSGARVEVPNDVVDFPKAVNLRYLNLRSKLQRYTDKELRLLLTSCPRLQSLNLAGCAWTLESNPNDADDFGGLELLFQHSRTLRHLNISGEHQHFYGKGLRLFAQFKGLESLSIPVCMLCPQNPSTVRAGKRVMSCQPRGRQAPKRRLTGSGEVAGGSSNSQPAAAAAPPTAIANLVSACPDLKELEILAVGFDSAIQRNKFINPRLPQFLPCIETRFVRDVDIEPISRLRYLRRLTLAGLPGLTNSQSLVKIAEGCVHIEFLSLAYIGASTFSGALCRALASCAHLKDFRIEQPHMALSRTFFEALSQCSRLERLCVIAKNSAFNPVDITRMVEQLRRLVVVEVLAAGAISDCKKLTSSLAKRYTKTRPGLSLTFYPLMYDGIAEVVTSIPAKHIEELTRFESHVAGQPLL